MNSARQNQQRTSVNKQSSTGGQYRYSSGQHRSPSGQQRKPREQTCGNCGLPHAPGQCPAYGAICRSCRRRNHYARCCRSTPIVNQLVSGDPDLLHTDQQTLPEALDEEALPEDYTYDDSDELYHIQTLSEPNLKDDIYSNLMLNGRCAVFQLDTGARCNVLPYKIYKAVAMHICAHQPC